MDNIQKFSCRAVAVLSDPNLLKIQFCTVLVIWTLLRELDNNTDYFLSFSLGQGECIGDAQAFLVKFCNKKCSLTKANATHLILKMSNLSINDSGLYKNEIKLAGLHDELEMEHFELNVQGKEMNAVQVYKLFRRWKSTIPINDLCLDNK